MTLPGVFADWHLYRKDGFRIDRSDGSLKLKFNASLWADAGDIGANDVLETAFPNLTGNAAQFSRARVTMRGWAVDVGDLKFQLEFAQQPQIKDMWFRFEPLPTVGRIRVGNMREPYSLENSTAGGNLTFMSRALPTLALAPGRNIGIATTNTAFDKRMTWSAGGFWNTGSFDNFGGAKDALSNSIGTDLVARVTGLARYADEGRDLIHLGLSLSHQNFNDQVRTRAVPETALTDDDLVDTGKISPNSAIQINPEFAIVSGPWSFQAEYFHSALKANSAGNSRLNGIYAFGSYLLTGESRHYDRGAGVFDGVRPKRKFEWGGDGWGAWEVALRVSTVDLTDGAAERRPANRPYRGAQLVHQRQGQGDAELRSRTGERPLEFPRGRRRARERPASPRRDRLLTRRDLHHGAGSPGAIFRAGKARSARLGTAPRVRSAGCALSNARSARAPQPRRAAPRSR